MHHRDGGPDPTELGLISSTGEPPPDRCVPHSTNHHSQPVMCGQELPIGVSWQTLRSQYVWIVLDGVGWLALALTVSQRVKRP
jgi:hypothetical protein